MPEANQSKWIGIRPTNPEEDIPVKLGQVSGLVPSNGTLIQNYLYSINGAYNLYIVPTGKVFYLCMLAFSIKSVGTGQAVVRILDDTSAVKFYAFLKEYTTTDFDNEHFTFNPPYYMQEGWVIKINSSSADIRINSSVYGYEN